VSVGQPHLCEEIGKLIRKTGVDETLAKAEAEYQATGTTRQPGTKRVRGATPPEVPSMPSRSGPARSFRPCGRSFELGETEEAEPARLVPVLARSHLCGKGNGSLLFHAFPQEIIDKIAEETGSTPVQVFVPDLVDGEIEFDEEGRVFLVEQFPTATAAPTSARFSSFRY